MVDSHGTRGIGCRCGWPLDRCFPPLSGGACGMYRHEQETHPALVRAREVAPYPEADRLKVADPHALWVLAAGDRRIYIQAMEVAGYLVPVGHKDSSGGER
jgi:hypothetical protein